MKKVFGFIKWLLVGVVAAIIALASQSKKDTTKERVDDAKKEADNRIKNNSDAVNSAVAQHVLDIRRGGNLRSGIREADSKPTV